MNFSSTPHFASEVLQRSRFFTPRTYNFIAFFIGLFGYGIGVGVGVGAKILPVLTFETPNMIYIWCLLNPTYVNRVNSQRTNQVNFISFGRLAGRIQVVLHEEEAAPREQLLDAVRIDFKTAYDTHHALTSIYKMGGLTETAYENVLKNNMIFFDGGWWTIGQTTGAWHVSHNGKTWRRTPSPFDDLNGAHEGYVNAEET